MGSKVRDLREKNNSCQKLWNKENREKFPNERETARTRERGRENNNFFPVSHLTLEALQQSWINIPPSLPFFLFVSVFLYGSLTHAQVKSQALSLQDEKFCAERPNVSIYRAVARNSSVTGQKIKKRCYFVWEKWQLGNVFYLKIILCILCFEKVKKKMCLFYKKWSPCSWISTSSLLLSMKCNFEKKPQNILRSEFFFFFKEKGIKKQKSFPETEVLQFLPMWLFSAVD